MNTYYKLILNTVMNYMDYKMIIHYDDSKSSKYIMYLDANNSYGWEMSQYLP